MQWLIGENHELKSATSNIDVTIQWPFYVLIGHQETQLLTHSLSLQNYFALL